MQSADGGGVKGQEKISSFYEKEVNRVVDGNRTCVGLLCHARESHGRWDRMGGRRMDER